MNSKKVSKNMIEQKQEFKNQNSSVGKLQEGRHRYKESEKLVKNMDMKNVTLKDIFARHTANLGGLEDGRLTTMYYEKFLFIDQVCTIFNLMGMGLSVIQYDLEYGEVNENVSTWLLWLIFTSSCALLILTVYRYEAYIQWLKIRKQMSSEEKLWNTIYLQPMIAELFIFCVIPLPFTTGIRVYFFNSIMGGEAYYHVNEILSLFMICRTFTIFRTILSMTFWYSNRTQRVCNLYACEANYMFVAKSLMRTVPYTSQMIAMVCLIVVFGYGVRICESPLSRINNSSNDLSLYSNALWNIIITITTVGYGDFFARTDLGRFIIFIACVMGIFIVSMMVVTLIESLKVTTLEGHAITVLERVQLRDRLKAEASSVICLVAKASFGYKNGSLSKKQHYDLIIRLKQKLIQFKIIHRQYKSISDNGSLNEEITNQFGILKKDFAELIKNQQQLVSSNNEIMYKLGMEVKLQQSIAQI